MDLRLAVICWGGLFLSAIGVAGGVQRPRGAVGIGQRCLANLSARTMIQETVRRYATRPGAEATAFRASLGVSALAADSVQLVLSDSLCAVAAQRIAVERAQRSEPIESVDAVVVRYGATRFFATVFSDAGPRFELYVFDAQWHLVRVLAL